ncbi:uncharacterized protein LOC119329310 [Triticum dicoccoides]|uniref:uncharacterized protein LOC119329310 n=1 Tax=Triticum dicoccoides TaxID=85692 RepID=UPI00189106BF|nr:uncharacterized protein LOC119329310 [Triticum dicoccoides]
MTTDGDIDMADLASLDAPASPAAAAAPSVRFQPNVKGKPKPKPKPKPKAKPAPKPKHKPEPEPEPTPEEGDPHAAAAAAAATLPEGGVDAVETDADRVGPGEGADDMDVEDEDFVVREIDVYFTPKPFDKDSKLYIMQYPLRPCWRPYELGEVCKEVRVKPGSSKVEVDLEVDTQSDNYDPEVSGSLRVTTQTLSSSEAADVSDYAVGVLRGNMVHLNHLDAVMQLRPSMPHLISGASRTRQPLQQVETNGGGAGGKAVPSAKGNQHPDGSKDSPKEPEPWISLTYGPAGSDVASKYYAEMVASEGRPIDFTMSTHDYALSLCPGGPTGSKNINRSQAIREMLSLPLEERLKKWFTEVSQVTRFVALMHLAPDCSEEDLLETLPVYADLVRGLWVCRSSLLYDDGLASKRDQIMLEFTKMESIPVKYVERLIRDERTRNMILNPLGKRRDKLQDYKFIVAADSSFIKRYSHIVKEQENAWSVRAATMPDPLEKCSATEQRKTKNSTKSNIPVKGPDPVMGKTKDGLVQGSENHVRSVLDSVFTANKVRSFPAVVRDLRHLAVKYASDRKDGGRFQALSNAAQTCVSLSRKELDASIRLVAVPVHDLYVQKSEEKASVRNCLIKLFRDRVPNGTLKKQEILDCALSILKRKISEKEYHQAVSEICISNEDGHLVLKNGEMP